jgi:hypothetical protein
MRGPRRTYATVAESSGISPLELKASLNHSLGDDVTSGYVIATVERLREPDPIDARRASFEEAAAVFENSCPSVRQLTDPFPQSVPPFQSVGPLHVGEGRTGLGRAITDSKRAHNGRG